MSVGAPIYWGLPVHYFEGMEQKKDTPLLSFVTKGSYTAVIMGQEGFSKNYHGIKKQ